jgi:membrane protease YdiL (CAAX protease family)
MVPWIAGLPLLLRLAVSVSAGAVEEGFFRGFLQPRVGVFLSTLFFALAHLSYEQPLMLVGITLLSLLFAALVRWRQNVLAAAAAHFAFDAIQLLVVIPFALRLLEEGGGLPIAAGAAALLLD